MSVALLQPALRDITLAKRLIDTASLDLDFARNSYKWDEGAGLVSKAMADIVTFTRASAAMQGNGAGVLESVGADVPRLDYDPVTLQARGLLAEEQRTNLLESSNAFLSSYWTYSAATLVANSTMAPDGTLTAGKLTEGTATGAPHRVTNSTAITAGVQYVASVYVKSAGNSRRLELRSYNGLNADSITIVDVELGTVISGPGQVEPVGNGWFRVWHTVTAQASVTTQFAYQIYLNNGASTYTGDGTSGIYIWGAQLEAGTFPTSYIPTTSAQVTRAADNAVINTLSPWFNASAGVLVVEASIVGGTPTIGQFDDGTENNVIRLHVSGGNIVADVISGGVSQASLTLGAAPAAGVPFKAAIAYAANDFAGCLNGGTVQTDSAGAVPSGLTTYRVRGRSTGVTGATRQRASRHFPHRLTNTELQRLTA